MASIQNVKDNYKNIEYFNPSLFVQLLRVSKIALWVGLSGIIIVSMLIVMILPAIPKDYADFIQYMARIQHDLPLMLGLSALLLISAAGFTVWVICLYSSFRIAGPLYRFARNLEEQIVNGPTQILQIRNEDRLQGECQLFNRTIASLIGFYTELKQSKKLLQSETQRAIAFDNDIDVVKFRADFEKLLKKLALANLQSKSL